MRRLGEQPGAFDARFATSEQLVLHFPASGMMTELVKIVGLDRQNHAARGSPHASHRHLYHSSTFPGNFPSNDRRGRFKASLSHYLPVLPAVLHL